MKKSKVVPLLTFLALVVVFFIAAFYLRAEISSSSEEVFQAKVSSEAKNITVSVDELLSEQYSILTAARALFDSSDNVTRDEWKLFSDSIGLEKKYPSVKALEYIKKIDFTEKVEYEKSVREDTSLHEEGYENYKVYPETESTELFVVHYVEPIKGNEEAFGYDLHSNDSRRKSLELARDTNSIIITSPLTLVQEKETQKSLLMILPVYQRGQSVETLEERQEFLEGYVLSVINADDLVLQALSSNTLLNIDAIQVDDITNDTIILFPIKTNQGAPPDSTIADEPIKTSRTNIGTRSWLFSFYSDQGAVIIGIERYIPFFIFGLGIIIATLLSLILYNSMRLRGQAEEMAAVLTQDLKKFELAIDSVSDQIVISDFTGTVLYANPATLKLTGYTMQEILGTKSGSLWSSSIDENFYKQIWDVVRDYKKPYTKELKNKRKNGEEYDALLNVYPVLDEYSKVLFFVAVEKDVSGDKKIANIKNQFVSLASHQLRTPLSAMKWNLEMLSAGDAGELQEEQSKLVKNIYQSSLRMISLVNSLLNISLVESGKIIVDPEPTDIISLVNDILSELKEESDKRNIELVTNFVSKLKPISVDPKLIREAYRNVLVNAVKYSSEGGKVTVKISVEEGNVLTEINDSGLGIPEKEQDQIFKKFHRGSNVITSNTDGTGLGLFMTKTIIESSGGKVWFNSIENEGTTFWFTLPLEGSKAQAGESSIRESDTKIELQSEMKE